MEVRTQWKLGDVDVKAGQDGLTINGQVIGWEEIDVAREQVAPAAFHIPIIGSAKE